MTLDTFKSIVDKHIASNQRQIKLLGGEPTQHPQFEEFLRYAFDNNVEVTIISNFLFSKEVRDVILRYLEKAPMHFLINATELDKADRMAIFRENYDTIYKFLYARDAETNIACGITIDPDVPVEKYISYVEYLQKNLIAIEKMRISLAFPGSDNQKGNFFFINNKKLGDYFVYLVKTLLNMNIPSTLDCILFPCMFEGKEEMKFLMKFFDQFNRSKCGDTAGPTDYLPDGNAIYCYPCNRLSVNTSKFKTNASVVESLRMKYAISRSLVDMPESCLKCGYYGNKCDGPCLGFFDIESV